MDTKNDLVGIYSKNVSTTQTTSNANNLTAKEYVLNKYNELSNCIVCDNDNINSKELLEKKQIKV